MARTAKLPGVGEERNLALTELAEKYVEQRDTRMKWLKGEVEMKNQLIELMQALGKTAYHDDEMNLTITLETKTKVKVKIGSDDYDDDSE